MAGFSQDHSATSQAVVIKAPALVFSSETMPRAERFQHYRRLYSAGSDTIEDGPNFSAELRAWSLDRLVVFDRKLSDVTHERLGARARDGFDHFTIQLIRRGSYYGDAGDGLKPVGVGEIILMDMTKPTRNRSVSAHILTISLARSAVEAAAGSVDDLHGAILQSRRAVLLAQYMVSLAENAPTMDPAIAPAATRALIELLAISIDPARAPSWSDKTLMENLRRESARRFIDSRLGSRDLGPESIAEAAGVSRATLYRLFEPYGGVAKQVRRQRLASLRTLLSNPSETRSLADLADVCGMSSESHCSRVFHEAFGVRPGEFRQDIHGFGSDAADMTENARRKFAALMTSVELSA